MREKGGVDGVIGATTRKWERKKVIQILMIVLSFFWLVGDFSFSLMENHAFVYCLL